MGLDPQLYSFLTQKSPKHTLYSTHDFQDSNTSTSAETAPTTRVPLVDSQVSRGFHLASYPQLPGSQALGPYRESMISSADTGSTPPPPCPHGGWVENTVALDILPNRGAWRPFSSQTGVLVLSLPCPYPDLTNAFQSYPPAFLPTPTQHARPSQHYLSGFCSTSTTSFLFLSPLH